MYSHLKASTDDASHPQTVSPFCCTLKLPALTTSVMASASLEPRCCFTSTHNTFMMANEGPDVLARLTLEKNRAAASSASCCVA